MPGSDTTYTPTRATTSVTGPVGGGGGGPRSSMDDLLERLIKRRTAQIGQRPSPSKLGRNQTGGMASQRTINDANYAPAPKMGAPMHVSYQGGLGRVGGVLRGPYMPGQSAFAGYAAPGEEMPQAAGFTNAGRNPMEERGPQPDHYSVEGREMDELRRAARAQALRQLYETGELPPQGK